MFDFSIEVSKAGINVCDDRMRVWVLASTEDQDEQGESLIQKSMDISYLTKDGKYTWGHSVKGRVEPENVLGIIDSGRIDDVGLYTEGEFFKSKSKALEIYKDFKDNPDICPHRASIEGSYKVFLDSLGNIQKSAIVRNVAFDLNVVNTNTMAGVVKSLHSGRECACMDKIPELRTHRDKVNAFIYHNAICKNEDAKTIKSIIKDSRHLFIK